MSAFHQPFYKLYRITFPMKEWDTKGEADFVCAELNTFFGEEGVNSRVKAVSTLDSKWILNLQLDDQDHSPRFLLWFAQKFLLSDLEYEDIEYNNILRQVNDVLLESKCGHLLAPTSTGVKVVKVM